MATNTGRIFSGVQPTGSLHLGNYLGALREFVRLQDDYECVFCVVDMHAITQPQDPAELRSATREVTAAFVACGLDPERNVLFNQSNVKEHAQLGWILNCTARVGWLNRMTQFKDKAGKDREGASVGLYVYPVLMTADILLYKATHVPVGEDQKQHLELARDIAQKFNQDYDAPDFFPQPEPLVRGAVARVMSLRDGTQKMSKSDVSDYSRINLTDTADEIALKLRRAKTDSDHLPGQPGGLKERPEAENLVGLLAALSDRTVEEVLAELEGKTFADLKAMLTEATVAAVVPIGEEIARIGQDPGYIDRVLDAGAERAREIAVPILTEVEEIVGFRK